MILENVTFDLDMRDIAKFLKEADTNIRKLSLTSCKMGDSSISAIISDCENLKTLEELILVDMNIGRENHTQEIIQSLSNHLKLKIIDLSRNQIRSFELIGEFLGKN